MSEQVHYVPARPGYRRLCGPAAGVVLGGFLVITGLTDRWPLLLLASGAYLLLATTSVREPMLFVIVFLAALETLPPWYFARTGDNPIYLCFLLLPIGLAIMASRLRDLRPRWEPVARGFLAFSAGTAFSLPFAWWLSGVGMSSVFRWLLLAQAPILYLLIRAAARPEELRWERWAFRLLLAGAVVSAAYGIVDFFWPVPLPHPAADQFIWIGLKVLRRAQGVFYESSNFANFCGFFLVIAAGAVLARKERLLGIPRYVLFLLIAVLGLAVLVAFSRSTWASVLVALFVFAVLTGRVNGRRGAVCVLALGAPLFLLWKLSPDLWSYLSDARLGILTSIFADPNTATSGRFDTWIHALSIINANPQYLVFGIGYKSLGSTRLFHGEIIMDNGYLSLLLETGIAGLVGFGALSAAILKTFSALSRSRDGLLAFWSAALFSIWCGELVQLFAVDAYTFWRNMAIYAALAAFTLNRAERIRAVEPDDGSGFRDNPRWLQ